MLYRNLQVTKRRRAWGHYVLWDNKWKTVRVVIAFIRVRRECWECSVVCCVSRITIATCVHLPATVPGKHHAIHAWTKRTLIIQKIFPIRTSIKQTPPVRILNDRIPRTVIDMTNNFEMFEPDDNHVTRAPKRFLFRRQQCSSYTL